VGRGSTLTETPNPSDQLCTCTANWLFLLARCLHQWTSAKLARGVRAMTVLDNMDGSPAQWLRHVAYVRTGVSTCGDLWRSDCAMLWIRSRCALRYWLVNCSEQTNIPTKHQLNTHLPKLTTLVSRFN
jgi:hypothetical protein